MADIERTRDFDRILSTYDSLQTERERTAAEGKLWEEALPSERKALTARLGRKADRGEWLAEILGNQESGPKTRNLYDLRTRLAKAPSELWDYVEASGCTLRVAIAVYKACLDMVLKDGSLSFATALQAVTSQPLPKPRVHHKQRKNSGESSRQDWVLLYDLVDKIVKPRLAAVPNSIRKQLAEELKAHVQMGIRAFFNKVKRYRDEEEGVSLLIRRERMQKACEMLWVDVPPPGELANLKKAKEMKWERVKNLHPDHRDDPTNPCPAQGDNALYQSIIEAYHDIEAYNNSIKRGD
jgi:hypothetical protein